MNESSQRGGITRKEWGEGYQLAERGGEMSWRKGFSLRERGERAGGVWGGGGSEWVEVKKANTLD